LSQESDKHHNAVEVVEKRSVAAAVELLFGYQHSLQNQLDFVIYIP
jgi:hypothetical protein